MTAPTRGAPLGLALTALFLLAMVMGSGPGLHLVNPDPDDPGAVFTIWGLPIIYVWGLAWYGVQLAAIVTAYKLLWKSDDETTDAVRTHGAVER